MNSCPLHIKKNCVNSLVKPILDYGCPIWDPHCNIDKDKLERVQKRAARFVTNNYIFESGNTDLNMNRLNWVPLEENRARSKLTLFYRAKNNIVDLPINHLRVNPRADRAGGFGYMIPQSNLNCHKYSYYPSTLRMWNNLPLYIKESKSIDCFKSNLEKIAVTSSIK